MLASYPLVHGPLNNSILKINIQFNDIIDFETFSLIFDKLVFFKKFSCTTILNYIIIVTTILLLFVSLVNNTNANSRVYFLNNAHFFYLYTKLRVFHHFLSTYKHCWEYEILLFCYVITFDLKML